MSINFLFSILLSFLLLFQIVSAYFFPFCQVLKIYISTWWFVIFFVLYICEMRTKIVKWLVKSCCTVFFSLITWNWKTQKSNLQYALRNMSLTINILLKIVIQAHLHVGFWQCFWLTVHHLNNSINVWNCCNHAQFFKQTNNHEVSSD